ncbi:DNA polymerase III subunit delta' [Porphyrobacter sp. HT-58-2]|uniref:DNA polymerase III subunit delta' n=1 Tax=Porphyrobacter sp. HT-58-2 TaxID=2023229 RepID=UPI000CDC658F|nr:DNA polymerase III subunit delta' [Porphyrobacter sp. HT-58-2]AUX69956.1 DNA polymerase III subunit delta' [Porphyrobacter sp. HT-58-2]
MTDWPNHAEAWRAWRDALAGERMHHAWLLAGKSGLGKRDFALAAARELVAEPGVQQPLGEHPDIITMTYGPKDEKAEKAQAEGKPFERARSIRIRQIRAMQRRLVTRPTLGSRRAIIIDPADDMEKPAANALLKSLEEPPAGTFFLLVTHRPARLLPTIRSRCRTLRFPVLTDSQLSAMLADEGAVPDPEAIAAADGSFGAAMRFAEQDLAPIAKLIAALIESGDNGMTERGELTRLIGQRADRERIQAVLDLAQALVARAARASDDPARRIRLIDTHAALVSLAAEAPTANFDAGMFPFEIGTLLVGAATASDSPHV